MSIDIGIDLGTASVLVYVKGKGVVLKEPSVVAFDRDTNAIKAIGEEARLMLGRTPGNIIAVRPLRQGVISDYTVTEKMIKYFVQKAVGKRTFKKPRISICVPSGVTEVEKKAVEEATFAAGAREVHLIEEPVAAAIGAGIDIAKPCGNMIVDIGGGTADIGNGDESLVRRACKVFQGGGPGQPVLLKRPRIDENGPFLRRKGRAETGRLFQGMEREGEGGEHPVGLLGAFQVVGGGGNHVRLNVAALRHDLSAQLRGAEGGKNVLSGKSGPVQGVLHG